MAGKFIDTTPDKVQVGCSGFHYKHWKGIFYPEDLPEKKWFEYYCQYFNTLELNVTFYRFPRLSTLQGWYKRSPENFLFAVKAPRIITHFKKLQGTADIINEFYKTIDQGLKKKLGCILFQFPPSFTFSSERLERIISSLDPAFKNVVEFRHISWWENEAYNQLGKHHITFCGMSHPDFPDDIINNSSVLYYRMHGGKQLYTSSYTESELNGFAKNFKNQDVEEIYIYFNNDVKGFALTNARSLLQKI